MSARRANRPQRRQDFSPCPGRQAEARIDSMDDKVLRLVYTFFLGVMLALFVGLGIQTFYPPPERPEYPNSLELKAPAETTPEEQQQQREFEREIREYEKAYEGYNRTVSILATSSAVILLGLSLLLERKSLVLTNGVMLGGLFTLLYGLGRGLASRDTSTTFITVAVALVVVLFLGYRRFLRPREEASPPGVSPGTPRSPASSD